MLFGSVHKLINLIMETVEEEEECYYIPLDTFKKFKIVVPNIPLPLLYQPPYTPLQPRKHRILDNIFNMHLYGERIMKNRKNTYMLLGYVLNLPGGKEVLGSGLMFFYIDLKQHLGVYIMRTDITSKLLFNLF